MNKADITNQNLLLLKRKLLLQSKLIEQYNEEKGKNKILHGENVNLRDTISTLEQQNSENHHRIRQLESENARLRCKGSELDRRNGFDSELDRLKKIEVEYYRLLDVGVELDRAQSLNQRSDMQTQELEDQCLQLRKSLDESTLRSRTLENELKHLRSVEEECTLLRKKSKELEQLKALQEEVHHLRAVEQECVQLRSLDSQFKRLQENYNTLKGENNTLNAWKESLQVHLGDVIHRFFPNILLQSSGLTTENQLLFPSNDLRTVQGDLASLGSSHNSVLPNTISPSQFPRIPGSAGTHERQIPLALDASHHPSAVATNHKSYYGRDRDSTLPSLELHRNGSITSTSRSPEMSLATNPPIDANPVSVSEPVKMSTRSQPQKPQLRPITSSSASTIELGSNTVNDRSTTKTITRKTLPIPNSCTVEKGRNGSSLHTTHVNNQHPPHQKLDRVTHKKHNHLEKTLEENSSHASNTIRVLGSDHENSQQIDASLQNSLEVESFASDDSDFDHAFDLETGTDAIQWEKGEAEKQTVQRKATQNHLLSRHGPRDSASVLGKRKSVVDEPPHANSTQRKGTHFDRDSFFILKSSKQPKYSSGVDFEIRKIDMIRGRTPVSTYTQYLIISLFQKYASVERIRILSDEYLSDIHGIAWNLLFMCDNEFPTIVDCIFQFADALLAANSIALLPLVDLFYHFSVVNTQRFAQICKTCFHFIRTQLFPRNGESFVEDQERVFRYLTFFAMMSNQESVLAVSQPFLISLLVDVVSFKEPNISVKYIPRILLSNRFLKEGGGELLQAIRETLIVYISNNSSTTSDANEEFGNREELLLILQELTCHERSSLQKSKQHEEHSQDMQQIFIDKINQLIDGFSNLSTLVVGSVMWELVKAVAIYTSRLPWEAAYDEVICDILWRLLSQISKENDIFIFVLLCVETVLNQFIQRGELNNTSRQSELQVLQERVAAIQALESIPTRNEGFSEKTISMLLSTLKEAMVVDSNSTPIPA